MNEQTDSVVAVRFARKFPRGEEIIREFPVYGNETHSGCEFVHRWTAISRQLDGYIRFSLSLARSFHPLVAELG